MSGENPGLGGSWMAVGRLVWGWGSDECVHAQVVV